MHALIRAAMVGACATAFACTQGVGTEPFDDASFVDVDDAGASTDTSNDGASTGPCSVLDPSACPVEAPRCVPAASRSTACVVAGTLAEGEACGTQGEDPCGYGLLCAAAATDAEDLSCRRICRPGATCGDGSACESAFEAGGESIGLCAGTARKGSVSP